MFAQLTARIQELTKNIEQTIAQHNFLSGALQEAQNAYAIYSALSGTPESATIEAGLTVAKEAADLIDGVSPAAAITTPEVIPAK